MLVAFIDHGVTPPPTLAARNAATTGAAIRGAVAAGVLGCGRHYGGGALACRATLDDGLTLVRTGRSIADAAADIAERLVAANDVPPPGFGHRFHTRDPRASRLLQLAHELEVGHDYTLFIRALERARASQPALGTHSLPINVDGAIAAVCGDIGLPPEVADALLLISRVPGLAAHVLEEQRREAPMRVIDPTMTARPSAGSAPGASKASSGNSCGPRPPISWRHWNPIPGRRGRIDVNAAGEGGPPPRYRGSGTPLPTRGSSVTISSFQA
jgi:citrate synthase